MLPGREGSAAGARDGTGVAWITRRGQLTVYRSAGVCIINVIALVSIETGCRQATGPSVDAFWRQLSENGFI